MCLNHLLKARIRTLRTSRKQIFTLAVVAVLVLVLVGRLEPYLSPPFCLCNRGARLKKEKEILPPQRRVQASHWRSRSKLAKKKLKKDAEIT